MSYHCSGLFSLRGVETIPVMVGLLPGQLAPQSPQRLKGAPLIILTTLSTCQPETTYVKAPLSASQRLPWPTGRSQTLVIARLCLRSKPVLERFMSMYANDWMFGV